MESTNKPKQSVAFINDKSPILDVICTELISSGTEILFRSESVEDGFNRLSILNPPPKVCVIDLDFYNKDILAQLHELKAKYPALKLIVHSDKDSEKAVKPLLEMGIESYLLIGSDVDDFKKAIEGAINGKRYFSVGVSKIASDFFGSQR